jgi:hypothetical protein
MQLAGVNIAGAVAGHGLDRRGTEGTPAIVRAYRLVYNAHRIEMRGEAMSKIGGK